MTRTAEEIMEIANLDSANKKSQKIKEDLDQVLLTEQGLEQIKENLNKMVDAMDHNPSFLARAASYWGEIPLWQKIVGGVVLIVPTLAIAMVLQSALFLAISIFTLITYAVSGFLLDNHHNLNINRTEHLKTGITGLADTLGVVIISLDKLREQLATEIEQFQLENEKLSVNVKDLSEEIQELVVQRKLLQETERALRQTNKELEQIADSLKSAIKEHTRLLEENEVQLKLARENYAQAQSDLTDKIAELQQVKEDMGEQNNQLSLLNDSLQGLLQQFSGYLKLDKQGQEDFKSEIKKIITDKTKSLLIIAERICKAEAKFDLLMEDYRKLYDSHLQLLNRQEGQVARLEQINTTSPEPETVRQAELLKKVGLYAVDTSRTTKKAPVVQDSAEVRSASFEPLARRCQ